MFAGTERTTTRPTLTLGSTGEDVKHLQRLLNVLVSTSLVGDGIFGVATEEAVKKFQKFSGLNVDGIVGPQTWERLESLDVQQLNSLIKINQDLRQRYT